MFTTDTDICDGQNAGANLTCAAGRGCLLSGRESSQQLRPEHKPPPPLSHTHPHPPPPPNPPRIVDAKPAMSLAMFASTRRKNAGCWQDRHCSRQQEQLRRQPVLGGAAADAGGAGAQRSTWPAPSAMHTTQCPLESSSLCTWDRRPSSPCMLNFTSGMRHTSTTPAPATTPASRF